MMGRQSRQTAMIFVDIESLIPETHLLRKIERMVFFDFIYDLLAPYYPATGRPSVDPVGMFKMLLIGYLYGIKSERRLVEEVQLNIAYRWFCGFELDDTIPNHSTFSKTRTRKWQQSDLFQKAFYEIVKQCIDSGLIDGEAMAADGSYIPANVSRESWINVEIEVEQSMQSYLDSLDEELLAISRELKTELSSAGHSLIHSQQDIIDYLNQIRTQVGFTRKLRRIKYLREQFELQEKTNVREVVDGEHSVVLEGVQLPLFKVSVPYLQTDEALEVILKVADAMRSDKVITRRELGGISVEQMENTEVDMTAVNTRKMMDAFCQDNADLFSFVMGYPYNREMDFDAKVTLFCRLLSLYENELEITDRFGQMEHIEYALIFKRK